MRIDLTAQGGGKLLAGEPAGLRHAANRLWHLSCREPGSAHPDEFEDCLEKLVPLLDPSFPVLPDVAGARLAASLDTMLRSMGPELAGPAFSCLAASGRLGLSLAAMGLADGTVGEDDARLFLTHLSPAVTLGLCNQILSGIGPDHGTASRLAAEMIPLAAGSAMSQLKPYLRMASGMRPALAYPLAEALWEGRLGQDIRKLSPSRSSMGLLSEAAQWLKLLRPAHGGTSFAAGLAEAGRTGMACRFLRLLPDDGGAERGRILSRLLASAREEDAARCLLAAMELAPKKAPDAAAVLYLKRPEARPHLEAVTAFLAGDQRKAFLARLTPDARRDTLSAMLARVAAADPLGLSRACRTGESLAVLGALAPRAGMAALALEAGLDKAQEHAAPADPVATPDQPRKDFSLRSLLGLGQPGQTGQPGAGELFARKDTVSGGVVRDRVFPEGSFREKSLSSSRFVRCSFERADFSRGTLESVSFEECSFTRCSFDEATLKDCVFTSCVFVGCGFATSALAGVSMLECSLKRCLFTSARTHGVDFSGSLLAGCDFTALSARALNLAGVLLDGCVLDKAAMLDVSCQGSAARGSTARMARAWNLSGHDPFFMAMEEETLRDGVELAAGAPGLGDIPEREAAAVLDAWAGTREALRRVKAHAAENARRLAGGRRVLGQDKAPLTDLLPLLIHSWAFDEALGMAAAGPTARIEAYVPASEALEAARAHFPGISWHTGSPADIIVEGVYTIGSFGTLAQTAGSDLDLWVVARGGRGQEAADGLRARLDAIERWAASAMGMEVHFYLMDREKVAANDFGVSHEEGSGSAQAMLLKEEFYRTAVLLAGRPPLWWAAPAGCEAGDYARLAADPVLSGELVDLGPPGRPRGEEFFGACLWQIFKSIASPYKSVMKFGLLERYASGAGGETLLCDAIKTSLASPGATMWDLDPYVRLFNEVHGHYQGAGLKEEAALVRLAFLAKSELAAKALSTASPATREECQARDIYYCKRPGGLCFAGKGGDAVMGFKEQARIGELLSRFFVRAYTRLTARMDALGGAAITPEDMTRLGRRIMAAFSKRRNKVDVMPFSQARGQTCQVLYLSASRGDKNAFIWHIQAGEAVPGESRLSIALSRDSRDLAAELVWLSANGVYGPGAQVSSDYTINPVTAKDVQEYLALLREFFPPETILRADTADALMPEAVARALVAVNLTQKREAAEVLELTVTYQTTWGELYVRTVRPRKQPPYEPSALVAAVSGLACSPGLATRWYRPPRSACAPPFGP